MLRRDFLATTLTSSAAAMLGSSHAHAQDSQPASTDQATSQPATSQPSPPRRRFNLRYAPHFGMFRHHAGENPIDELKFIADQGFTALEDNGMAGRPVEQQQQIAAEMSRLGINMGIFVANPNTAWGKTLAPGKSDGREKFLDECRLAVEVAKRVNATWMTVVPGALDERLDMEYQNANVIEGLRRAAELFRPHGLVMVIEALNRRRDHPGMFLTSIAQGYMICKAVNNPACKVLFDMYHQQVTEGNLINNIDLAWSEIGYFQIGDNPGRCEPGTGEVNYKNVFRHIYVKGYTGILGMEHGNSIAGKEGELAVIDAYVNSDRLGD